MLQMYGKFKGFARRSCSLFFWFGTFLWLAMFFKPCEMHGVCVDFFLLRVVWEEEDGDGLKWWLWICNIYV